MCVLPPVLPCLFDLDSAYLAFFPPWTIILWLANPSWGLFSNGQWDKMKCCVFVNEQIQPEFSLQARQRFFKKLASSWLTVIQICPLWRTFINLNISFPLHITRLTPFGIYRGNLGLFNSTKCEGVGLWYISLPHSENGIHQFKHILQEDLHILYKCPNNT